MNVRNSVARLGAALRDAATPSVSVVLANATREVARLEQVSAAAEARADRLYDVAREIQSKADDTLYEAHRGKRVAARFRELLD